MQILSVKPIGGKTAKRYHVHVYMDDSGIELDIPLYFAELKRYHIEEMAEIPDSLYTEIVDEFLRTRIITRCEYLLNAKAFTGSELKAKLSEGFYPEPLIDEAVMVMKSYHFIDDVDYAHRYVELNGHRKSRRMIALELKSKGIEETLIDEVTAELYEAQEDILLKLLTKRCKPEALDDQKERVKQIRFLVSKGFDYDDINHAINIYRDQIYNYED